MQCSSGDEQTSKASSDEGSALGPLPTAFFFSVGSPLSQSLSRAARRLTITPESAFPWGLGLLPQ
jgi:hypothetical protein